MAFLDRGREVLNKVRNDVDSIGKVEMEPRMEGAYMRMMVCPSAAAQIQKAEKPKSAEDAARSKNDTEETA
jgi:translation initiation factor IF-3